VQLTLGAGDAVEELTTRKSTIALHAALVDLGD